MITGDRLKEQTDPTVLTTQISMEDLRGGSGYRFCWSPSEGLNSQRSRADAYMAATLLVLQVFLPFVKKGWTIHFSIKFS